VKLHKKRVALLLFYMTTDERQRLVGVPMPLIGLPECELAEIERNKTTNGCTLVEYAGSDGNTYHLFIGDDGPTWLITRYPKVQR
jgi:hypothetical protein